MQIPPLLYPTQNWKLWNGPVICISTITRVILTLTESENHQFKKDPLRKITSHTAATAAAKSLQRVRLCATP